MGKPLILLNSITFAMKSKDLLNNNGFSAELQRIPKGLQKQGCSYGVYVSKNIDEAINFLTKKGIKVLGRIEVNE